MVYGVENLKEHYKTTYNSLKKVPHLKISRKIETKYAVGYFSYRMGLDYASHLSVNFTVELKPLDVRFDYTVTNGDTLLKVGSTEKIGLDKLKETIDVFIATRIANALTELYIFSNSPLTEDIVLSPKEFTKRLLIKTNAVETLSSINYSNHTGNSVSINALTGVQKGNSSVSLATNYIITRHYSERGIPFVSIQLKTYAQSAEGNNYSSIHEIDLTFIPLNKLVGVASGYILSYLYKELKARQRLIDVVYPYIGDIPQYRPSKGMLFVLTDLHSLALQEGSPLPNLTVDRVNREVIMLPKASVDTPNTFKVLKFERTMSIKATVAYRHKSDNGSVTETRLHDSKDITRLTELFYRA